MYKRQGHFVIVLYFIVEGAGQLLGGGRAHRMLEQAVALFNVEHVRVADKALLQRHAAADQVVFALEDVCKRQLLDSVEPSQ